MKKVIRLTEADLARIVKRVISEQGTITSAPQNQQPQQFQGTMTSAPYKPKFPKDDAQLNAFPNTPDGGKKVTGDFGGSDVIYPNGKTKNGECWCSGKGGIIISRCDGIENHCKEGRPYLP